MHCDRFFLSFHFHWRNLLEPEQVRSAAMSSRAHEDFTALRSVHQSRGQIYSVAHDRVISPAVRSDAAGHHRTGVDADMHSQVSAACAIKHFDGIHHFK